MVQTATTRVAARPLSLSRSAGSAAGGRHRLAQGDRLAARRLAPGTKKKKKKKKKKPGTLSRPDQVYFTFLWTR